MNLQGCEDYLVKMHFHISAADIGKYNEAFTRPPLSSGPNPLSNRFP